LATKSARVKVLVLVYELNVKVTYFKSLAKNNGKLCKKQGGGKWVLAKNVTHIHIISFSQLLDATRKAQKLKAALPPGERAYGTGGRGRDHI